MSSCFRDRGLVALPESAEYILYATAAASIVSQVGQRPRVLLYRALRFICWSVFIPPRNRGTSADI